MVITARSFSFVGPDSPDGFAYCLSVVLTSDLARMRLIENDIIFAIRLCWYYRIESQRVTVQ